MKGLPYLFLLLASLTLAEYGGAKNVAAADMNAAAKASNPNDEAAAIVESLGGSIFRDTEKPDEPVSAIIFYRPNLPPGVSLATKGGKVPLTHVSDADLQRLLKLKLPALESLGVSGLQVTDAGIVDLKNFPKLRDLRLAGSAFTDRGFETVAKLENLVNLGFCDSSLTDQGLAQIGRLKKVHDLDLSGNKGITDTGLVHLQGLKSLHSLNLSGTSVTDAGLAHLAALPNLGILSLDQTQVTDAGLVHLLRLPKLSQLSLNDTLVSPAGLTQLNERSPMLGVSYNKIRGVVSLETAVLLLYVLVAIAIVLLAIAGVHFVALLGVRNMLTGFDGQLPELVPARLYVVPLAWFLASFAYHVRQFVEGKWIEAKGRSGQVWSPEVDSFPILTYAVWITWAVCTIVCACYYFRILRGKYSLVPRLIISFLVVTLQLFIAVVLNAVFAIITYLGGGGPMEL
jgi:hypothetical protein